MSSKGEYYKDYVRAIGMTDVNANLINAYNQWALSQGISQKDAAEIVGMSVSTYKRMLSGENTKIDLEAALKIGAVMHCPLKVLCGFELNDEERFYGLFNNLPDRGKRYIRALLEFETVFRRDKCTEADECITAIIPVGNEEDGMTLKGCNYERINISAHRNAVFYDKIDIAIRIDTNEFIPVYQKGDTLLVSSEKPKDGEVGIFINTDDDRVFLRRFWIRDSFCLLEPVSHTPSKYGFDTKRNTIRINRYDMEEMSRWYKMGTVIAHI